LLGRRKKDKTDGTPRVETGPDQRKFPSRTRKRSILEIVRQRGYVSVDGLSELFKVTPQTIRRDINNLCHRGLLKRYHGGAGLTSSVENVAYQTRQAICSTEKRRIAQLVAGQVPHKASLFLDIGTTTEEVAKALLHHSGLRVITNNLNVASILCQNEGTEIIIAGGEVRHRDRAVIGVSAVDFVERFKVDIGIIGISGVDTDGDLLDFDYREVRVARSIIDNSRRVWLVCDHTKFGRNAMVRLGHVSELTAIFTDAPPPPPLMKLLKDNRVKLHLAPEDALAAEVAGA
jgi:DeoR family glycerol-3-phosphate regulon repressor